MTTKADFTAEEWENVLHGPPTAALIVITAQRGGTFRETLALTQSYVEARKQHGQSELLDEIVSSRPALDHTRYGSPQELKAAGLQHLRAAVESRAPIENTGPASATPNKPLSTRSKQHSPHQPPSCCLP